MNKKIAFVTGGSRGIGKAIVKKLGEDGYIVGFNYVNSEEAANKFVEELKSNGIESFAIKFDVSNYDEVEEGIKFTQEKYGNIDVLVNNAGITKDKLFIRMKESDFDDVINVNLKGTYNVTKQVAHKMMKKRQGRIINISSIAGLVGNAGQVNYSASKSAVIGMTRSLAVELGGHGVTVNAVAPGFIKTEMTDVLPENIKERLLGMIPLKSIGTPEDGAKKKDKFVQYAIAAVKEAIRNSNLDINEDNMFRSGVVMGSGIGGLKTIQDEYEKYLEKGVKKVSSHFIPKSIVNMAAGHISIELGTRGVCMSDVTACASGTDSIVHAFRLIKDGYQDIMFACGCEAAICELGIVGFESMSALSFSEDKDRASISFDSERSGFVMGEGAAILVLEELNQALKRNANIICEIVGYGQTCDSFHITAPRDDGEGARCSMEYAIDEAGISPDSIEYINAHGTSTELNDKSEMLVIQKVFKDKGVYVKKSVKL